MKPKTPQTTILIPSYNCGNYLLECLGSILRQNYDDYEILLIDDGSTDQTEKIIRSLEITNLRYYQNKSNLGIVPTLNRGLKLAKGKYIARMDADDVMLGNRLTEQIEFLENNPDFGMIGGSYQIMDGSGIYRDTVHTRNDPDFLKLSLMFRNQFHHAAITMRAEIAKELKYSTKFPYCEDHELWIRFSEVSKVNNLKGIYLSYRWHVNNSCSKNQATLKTSVLSLMSRELDKITVEHNARELMLHGSVCFGMGNFKFRDTVSVAELKKWYDKIFTSTILKQQYSSEWLENFRKEILKSYCGINE
ncbi:glycosyltransferase family 2 protein [Pedobacter suwonensis]|uniref:glycosyltransferase family 2 protein n=1 Tax=Pedobacter suwonensis TaxID=332999 RepID=UPI0011A2B9C6|nr:glycosyltransferase [Pedobacter suwonensis]